MQCCGRPGGGARVTTCLSVAIFLYQIQYGHTASCLDGNLVPDLGSLTNPNDTARPTTRSRTSLNTAFVPPAHKTAVGIPSASEISSRAGHILV
eukprot:3717512-Rhodomonas_salina.1